MSNFDNIYGVWKDLNKSYSKMAKGASVLQFAKMLINYDAGESGKLALQKMLHESATDSEEKIVEEISNRIDSVYANIEYFEKVGEQPTCMEELCQIRSKQKINFQDMATTPSTYVVSVDKLIANGSALHVEKIDPVSTDQIVGMIAQDYTAEFYDLQSVIAYFKSLNSAGPERALKYTLLAGLQSRIIDKYLVVAESAIVMDKLAAAFEVLHDEIIKEGNQPMGRLLKVKDKFHEVCIVGAVR